jgi:hypothetical protein
VERLKQKDHEFQSSLGYINEICLKKGGPGMVAHNSNPTILKNKERKGGRGEKARKKEKGGAESYSVVQEVITHAQGLKKKKTAPTQKKQKCLPFLCWPQCVHCFH